MFCSLKYNGRSYNERYTDWNFCNGTDGCNPWNYVRSFNIMGRKRKNDPFAVEEVEILDPDFKQPQMIIQLRKVVDSIGNPKPLHWVRTDSDRNIWVAHKHAKTIVNMYDQLTSKEATSSVVQNRQDPAINARRTRLKREFMQRLQTTVGLQSILEELRA